MNNTMLQEDVIYDYDDSFRISIPELLRLHIPDRVEELRDILNNNGYYGRYKLYYQYAFGRKTKEVVLKIYLIHSNVWYHFNPNLDYHFIEGHLPGLYIDDISFIDTFLAYDLMEYLLVNRYAGSYSAARALNVDEKIIKKTFNLFERTGVTHNKIFLLRDQRDLPEMYKNLIYFL